MLVRVGDARRRVGRHAEREQPGAAARAVQADAVRVEAGHVLVARHPERRERLRLVLALPRALAALREAVDGRALGVQPAAQHGAHLTDEGVKHCDGRGSGIREGGGTTQRGRVQPAAAQHGAHLLGEAGHRERRDARRENRIDLRRGERGGGKALCRGGGTPPRGGVGRCAG